MKAIMHTKYGSPDLLEYTDIEKPTPKENQVLIKVYAASANPLEWRTVRATPFIVRTSEGFFKPDNPRLGTDVAGRVEAVGSNVTQFKVGDEVFGAANGSFAEYACAKATNVVLKPANVSFEQAASVPVAGITALQGLRAGNIQAGQKVLVNGASGGVGTMAVQIAKALGAEVTGVCSTRNVELVRSIGADHVIDYTKENFTELGQRYDLIIDNVVNHSLSAIRGVLTPDGMSAVLGFWSLFKALKIGLLGKRGGQKIFMVMAKVDVPEDLAFLAELMETGKLVPMIDRCYPLNETAQALHYLETKRARAKVVITVA